VHAESTTGRSAKSKHSYVELDAFDLENSLRSTEISLLITPLRATATDDAYVVIDAELTYMNI
jgi:hypothetical protein